MSPRAWRTCSPRARFSWRVKSKSRSESATESAAGEGAGDRGLRVRDRLRAVLFDELGAESAVAFDGRLADHLRDLVDLRLLRGQALLELIDLSFQSLVFLERFVVKVLAF